MIRVLIVDDAPNTRTNIERVLGGQAEMETVGSAEDGTSAIAMTGDLHPDVVLMDLDLQQGDGLRATQVIAHDHPSTAVIVMGLDDDAATMRMVNEVGARDYLVKPFGSDELIATIQRVVAHSAQADAEISVEPVSLEPAAVIPASLPIARLGTSPQLIAVIAGKGGVGASAFAANIALLASNEAHKRTALVDFDLQHGDVRRLLRIDSPENLADLASQSPTAEKTEVIRRLIDGPAGVMALLAPAQPRLDAQLSAGFVEALTLQLRNLADIVVMDLPSQLTPASESALVAADRIVLVCGMSDPGVRATQGMLSLFAELGIPPAKIEVVLNRNEANSDLTKVAVEEALGRQVTVQLPYDPILVSTAVNRGTPFVLQKPDAQVSRKLRELASSLFELPQLPRSAPEHGELSAPLRGEEGPTESGRRRKKKGLFSFGKDS